MDQHRHLGWSIAFYVCIIASFALLEQALRTIPIGTAYAMWTGIGTVGVAVVGVLVFGDPITWARVFFLVLLVVALVGLKLSH